MAPPRAGVNHAWTGVMDVARRRTIAPRAATNDERYSDEMSATTLA